MRKESWNLFALNFKDYVYLAAIDRFIERATAEMHPLALILFGSLARGDYHQHSDTDVCVIFDEPFSDFFGGYDRVVACDPSGIVQPLVYNPNQFRQMISQANGIALEIMADGLFLAGNEAFRKELEALAAKTRQRLDIKRTTTGWQIMHPEKLEF